VKFFNALKNNSITTNYIAELGDIFVCGEGRLDENQVTVADLTGVAIQDNNIAEAVYLASNGN